MRARVSLSTLAAFLLVACAGWLGVRAGEARPFEHRAHVQQGVACVRCHAGIAESRIDTLPPLPTPEDCIECHSEPHDMRPCNSCHGTAENRHALGQAREHLAFSHRAHGGPKLGQCVRCHGGVLGGDAPLRPTMATCLTCHEHREQWAARRCQPCHTDLKDEGVRPRSHVVHGPDFMARHGMAAASSRDLCSSCHEESECASCHGVRVPGLPQLVNFDEPGRGDMHPRGFMSRHGIEARVDPATCLSCHRDERFCRDCHAERGLLRTRAAGGNPHPPGWVGPGGNRHGAEARQNPAQCASCHGGAGEQLCVECHRVGGPGGSPHPAGFDSRKPMSELPCRLCHGGAP